MFCKAEPPKSKKGNLTALWEYTAKSAVAHKEISEYEGIQVIQCWAEADQMQDSFEKATKFRTALHLMFGPLKGSTIHDLVRIFVMFVASISSVYFMCYLIVDATKARPDYPNAAGEAAAETTATAADGTNQEYY